MTYHTKNIPISITFHLFFIVVIVTATIVIVVIIAVVFVKARRGRGQGGERGRREEGERRSRRKCRRTQDAGYVPFTNLERILLSCDGLISKCTNLERILLLCDGKLQRTVLAMINNDVYVRPTFTVSRREGGGGGDRGGGGGGGGGGDAEEDGKVEEFLDREVTLYLGLAGTFYLLFIDMTSINSVSSVPTRRAG